MIRRGIVLFLLIFNFHSLIKAEIASEFYIQDLTIGDTLLKMYSKNEIEDMINNTNAVNFYPSSKKFYTLATFGKDEEYHQLNIDLKYKDKNYKIYGLSQYKRLQYNDCIKEQNTIKENLKILFENKKYELESYSQTHQGDPSGNSKYTSVDFFFEDMSNTRIVCTDWGKEFEAEAYKDNIDVGISSKEFYNFLLNEAYK